jgi:hypothetical protein
VLWPTQKFEQFELLVSKDDYASRQMVWDLKTGDAIPSSYIVKLKGAVHIGGFVVDPEGNPVAEASVSLSRFWLGGESRQSKYLAALDHAEHDFFEGTGGVEVASV